MNRIFKLEPGSHRPPRCRFIDVTATAIACGHAIPIKIEAQLFRNYWIPTEPDDQGRNLLRALLEEFHFALAEKTPAKLISHGLWLSVYFDFAAQDRQKEFPEILSLRFVLGPCTSNSPSLAICFAFPPSHDESAPF
jgi:hypothetical protein